MIFTEKDARVLEHIRTLIHETLDTVRRMGRDLDPDLLTGIASYLEGLDDDVRSEIAQFQAIGFDAGEELSASAPADDCLESLDLF